MGLRGKVRRLKKAAEEELFSFDLEGGTVARVPRSSFQECFVHEYERGKRHFFGEEPARRSTPAGGGAQES